MATSTGMKKATRARMAETGENYTTALRKMLAPCDCGAEEDPDGETMCNCTARRAAGE